MKPSVFFELQFMFFFYFALTFLLSFHKRGEGIKPCISHSKTHLCVSIYVSFEYNHVCFIVGKRLSFKVNLKIWLKVRRKELLKGRNRKTRSNADKYEVILIDIHYLSGYFDVKLLWPYLLIIDIIKSCLVFFYFCRLNLMQVMELSYVLFALLLWININKST